MKLIVDANILFSAVIKDGITRSMLLNLQLDLFAPDFVLEEFAKYEQYLKSKSNCSEKQFKSVFNDFIKLITIVTKQEYANNIEKAKLISPDIKDSMYFALAQKLNCSIWSNDKRLKAQKKVKVFSTDELKVMLYEN